MSANELQSENQKKNTEKPEINLQSGEANDDNGRFPKGARRCDRKL